MRDNANVEKFEWQKTFIVRCVRADIRAGSHIGQSEHMSHSYFKHCLKIKSKHFDAAMDWNSSSLSNAATWENGNRLVCLTPFFSFLHSLFASGIFSAFRIRLGKRQARNTLCNRKTDSRSLASRYILLITGIFQERLPTKGGRLFVPLEAPQLIFVN